MNQIVYDDYNSQIRRDQTTMATLTTNCGVAAEKNGVKIIEIRKKGHPDESGTPNR